MKLGFKNIYIDMSQDESVEYYSCQGELGKIVLKLKHCLSVNKKITVSLDSEQ